MFKANFAAGIERSQKSADGMFVAKFSHTLSVRTLSNLGKPL